MIDQEKIHNQCFNGAPMECIEALGQLKSNFSLLPDKKQAWDDLVWLTNDDDKNVRVTAIKALGYAFPYVPDKQQAWNDLYRLILNEHVIGVQENAISVLGSVFSHVPDKEKAWKLLYELTDDERESTAVRLPAIEAMVIAFPHVPNKDWAWSTLTDSIHDENMWVRYKVARNLFFVSLYMPNKEKAWDDLMDLKANKDKDVAYLVCHSLAQVSILKASQAETEDDFKKELEKAIAFFEESSNMWLNPSQFCLPFYRSFYSIVFAEAQKTKVIDQYLEEAKVAIKGSKNKELLFEAIENLANALKEVQDIESLNLKEKKDELKFYRIYCDRASELMEYTEKIAPSATMLLRKGMPILDRNLKRILEEIQDKAKIACQVSQGTPTQEIACEINREVQKWEIGSQEEMTQMIENLAYILEVKISVQPKNQYILGKIGQMKSERNLVRQYEILSQIIPLIRNVTVVPVEPVLEKIESLEGKLDAKLEEMIVSLKSGPKAELVISKGPNIAGFGAQIVTTIPLAEMKYPEINIDLEEIKEEGTKLSELRKRFADKIKGYLP